MAVEDRPGRDATVPEHVLEAYGAIGASTELLTGGRTNRTLRVRAGHELVLQQLRAFDGVDLLGIMENLVRVTSHLGWKARVEAIEAGTSGSGQEPVSWWPELVPTEAKKPYLVDADGAVWRAFTYRPGRIARSQLPPESLASVAGLFGRFSRATADLDFIPFQLPSPNFRSSGRGMNHDFRNIQPIFKAGAVPILAQPSRYLAGRKTRSPQPTRNSTPPIGVIAPNHFTFVNTKR